MIIDRKPSLESESQPAPETILYEGSTLSVPDLHRNLCRRIGQILRSPDEPDSQLQWIRGTVESLRNAPDTLERLYLFSALPEILDDLVAEHCVNTALCALRFATELGLPAEDIVDIGSAALLHDAGMLDIPADIVRKKDLLTPEECRIMQGHTVLGQRRLSPMMDGFPFLAQVLSDHHERLDGKGYPAGKKAILDKVQLIGIADFFEAVTHQRPQRGPVTPHEGMKMLLDFQKGAFDASIMKAFVKAFSLFPVLSVVQLNSGIIGQVVRTSPELPLRPVVRVLLEADGTASGGSRELDLSQLPVIYITRNISDREFIDRFGRP